MKAAQGQLRPVQSYGGRVSIMNSGSVQGLMRSADPGKAGVLVELEK